MPLLNMVDPESNLVHFVVPLQVAISDPGGQRVGIVTMRGIVMALRVAIRRVDTKISFIVVLSEDFEG